MKKYLAALMSSEKSDEILAIDGVTEVLVDMNSLGSIELSGRQGIQIHPEAIAQLYDRILHFGTSEAPTSGGVFLNDALRSPVP